MNKNILVKDFEEAIKDFNISSYFCNKTVLVTGGTGLIGSMVVRFLVYADEKLKLNLKVLMTARDAKKVIEVFGDEVKVETIEWDASEELYCDHDVDFVIHTAAITNSKMMISNPIDVINTSIEGTKKILDFACKKKSTVVYLSSMEVYGNPGLKRKIKEDDLGYIDLANPRSCYPESKRLCENLCTAYSVQKGLHVRIARLAQTFGAGVSTKENRVFAQFAKSVVRGENIILHTLGKSEGNYVYTTDAVVAILMLLVYGNDGEAYNIANEESHTTIAEMAEMVATKFGEGCSKVVYDIPETDMYGYAPDTILYLSSEKIRALGWKANVDLVESYKRMINYMRDEWE